MTTLDPSHLPWLAGNADPGTGAAVHTSVRGVPAPAPSSKSKTSGRRQENDPDADEHDAIRLWQREHRKQRRRERDEARQANRIPTLPLPDVRFEQSYLLSIQPFIHTRAPEAGPSSAPNGVAPTTDTAGAADAQVKNHASSSSRDKRRKLEESLALVADPAANHTTSAAGKGKGKGNAMDALFETGALVRIDWGQIAYLTVRDQILSPLVQGALWALGGIVYTSFRAYLRGAPALLDASSRPTAKGGAGYRNSSSRPSFLDRLLAPLKLRSPL